MTEYHNSMKQSDCTILCSHATAAYIFSLKYQNLKPFIPIIEPQLPRAKDDWTGDLVICFMAYVKLGQWILNTVAYVIK